MARKIRRSARRHRALALLSALTIVAGTTLAMAAAVGAEESTTPDTATTTQDTAATSQDTAATTQDSGTTTEEVATEDTGSTPAEPPVADQPAADQPAADQPAADQPVADQPVADQPSSAASPDLRANNHTTFPQFVECLPNGSPNPWESDSRADPGGTCTDGNFSQGGDQLAKCVAAFGNGVTNFYDSVNSTGTGNSDVTGAITAHPGGGTQLNVTPDPGVVIDGVFVKAGDAYNAYIGNESDMIGPLVGNWDPSDNVPSPNFANISHYLVCYHFTEVTGSLNVVKSVVGDANGADFTVEVDCNDGTTHDRTAALNSELVFDENGVNQGPGTLPITGIPVGTTCTVTETDDGGADSAVITPNDGVVVIAADTEAEVTVTNTFLEEETGGLTVDKDVIGTPPGGATFTVTVDCETDDSGDGTLVFDENGNLTNAGTIDTLPIIGLPVGTSCTVTETGSGQGGADNVQITGSPAVIVAGQISEVTVTNTFNEEETGSLNVEKIVEGTPPENTTFTVQVNCDDLDSSHDRAIVLGTELVFDDSGVNQGPGTLPITGIPVGTTCTVAETDDGGATVVITPNNGTDTTIGVVVITANTEAEVTVTNTFTEVGGVSVENPAEGSSSTTLPFTGSSTNTLVGLAAMLLVLGTVALLITRRRRTENLSG